MGGSHIHMFNSRQHSSDWQDYPQWKQDRISFDRVAEAYDIYRPGYPDALVDFVISASGLGAGGQILEVGCGTGKATRLFADRGFTMVCIEPGGNLADVARQRLAEYPGVSFEISTFEDWDARGRQFDLVLSTQAWHWVPREVGYAKAASVLRTIGSLALVWNMYPDPQGSQWDAMQQIYDRFFPPERVKDLPYLELAERRTQEIANSGYFEPPQVGTFPWLGVYSTQEYLGLLSTYSDHIALPADLREKLFTAIADLIENNGGKIEKPYAAYAYVARKK
jgi:SAM-dependent methyltransferase